MYKQGDIILIRYPLSDKPTKSIIRPVLVISNERSNNQDKDILVCQITTRIRNNNFSYQLNSNADIVTVPLPHPCEIRCNKIATIRVWEEIILNKISEVTPNALSEIVNLVKTVFQH